MTKRHLRYTFITAFFLIGLTWFWWLHSTLALPDTSSLENKNPESTAYIDAFKERHKDVKIKQIWVPYNRISPYLKEAVLAGEDDQFFEHPGFSWDGIKKAAKYNWKKKKFARGASTITQQLARNLYLSPSKNPIRKAHELLIALKLERELSKQRILELYLNVVEWGYGIYGCEAAARYYYGKSAANIGPGEAAYLASILPSPRRLGKRGPTSRAERILNRIY